MRFSCDRVALVERLNVLARGVSSRSALPVLSGILLQAREGRLELFSTDMELSIKATVTTAIEAEGETVVPARLFTDVIKNMDAAQVHVESTEGSVKITAGKAVFTLNSWVASDFPHTSTFDMDKAFTIGSVPLVETLEKVGRAASRDETRPILTGVLVKMGGGIAQDGRHRQLSAERQRDADRGWSQGRARGDRAGQGPETRSSASPEPSTRGRSRSPSPRTRHSSRSATCGSPHDSSTGSSPTTGSCCPTASTTRSSMQRDELLAVARRVSLLAQKNTPLRLQFSAGKLTIRAVTQDVGQAEEETRRRLQR